MKNVKFPLEDIKIHIKGNLAWVTYSYNMSGEYKGRQFDSAGARQSICHETVTGNNNYIVTQRD